MKWYTDRYSKEVNATANDAWERMLIAFGFPNHLTFGLYTSRIDHSIDRIHPGMQWALTTKTAEIIAQLTEWYPGEHFFQISLFNSRNPDDKSNKYYDLNVEPAEEMNRSVISLAAHKFGPTPFEHAWSMSSTKIGKTYELAKLAYNSATGKDENKFNEAEYILSPKLGFFK